MCDCSANKGQKSHAKKNCKKSTDNKKNNSEDMQSGASAYGGEGGYRVLELDGFPTLPPLAAHRVALY